MSGGYLDYEDIKLNRVIEQLEKDSEDYPTDDLIKLTTSLRNILHAYDLFASGDTNTIDFGEVFEEEKKKILEVVK